jgi:hypothetical protein
MRDNPKVRTVEDFQNDSERVREFYRKQGEERERSKQAHPASFDRDLFDAGVIVERTRITALLVDELLRTSVGTFDAKSVLAKLIKAVLDDR